MCSFGSSLCLGWGIRATTAFRWLHFWKKSLGGIVTSCKWDKSIIMHGFESALTWMPFRWISSNPTWTSPCSQSLPSSWHTRTFSLSCHPRTNLSLCSLVTMTPTSTYQVCNLGVCGISPNFELPFSLCICIVCTCISSHFPFGILHRIMAASLWGEEEHHQSNAQKTSFKLLDQSLASKNKKVQKSDPSSLPQNDNFLMGYLLRKTMPLNWSPNDVRTRGRYISLKV